MSTNVENAFITDYLTEADGDAVKVYLYGLYLCKNVAEEFSLSDFAKSIFIDEERVKDAFRFWEEFDLVSIISEEPFTVRYLPIVSYGKPRRFKAGKYDDFCKSLQLLLNDSRMISPNEYLLYFSVMEDYNIKPEAMLMICKYCIDLKGETISAKYICAVAKEFAGRGITTVDLIEEELSDYNLKSADVSKVLGAMGIRRKADIEEYNLFTKWHDELSFEIKAIVFAAKLFKAKSPKFLDEKLMELYSAKCFTEKEITGYVARQTELTDLARTLTRSLSVYVEVMRPVIENYLNPWLALGFDEDTLKFIANYCFTHRKRSLEEMDATVKKLYEKGLVNLPSLHEYVKTIAVEDEFIKKVFDVVSIDRHPNEWDRKNLSIWRDWGFSDEMIVEAAKFAIGKSNPIAYINSVLSSWKSQHILSADKIPSKKEAATGGRTANDRTYSKEELDALIQDADKVEF